MDLSACLVCSQLGSSKNPLGDFNAWKMMSDSTKGMHLWWTSFLAILWVFMEREEF